jgi:hypothetical protein
MSYNYNIQPENAHLIITYIMKDLFSDEDSYNQVINAQNIDIIFNLVKKLQLNNIRTESNSNKIEYIKKYSETLMQNSNKYKKLFKYFLATYIIKYTKNNYIIKIDGKEYDRLKIIENIESCIPPNFSNLDIIFNLIISEFDDKVKINNINRNIYNNNLFSGLDPDYKILIIKLVKFRKNYYNN